MKRESRYYIASIQWQDNKNIQDGMILKVGDIEEDDDQVFFYLEDDSEIEEYKKDGVHEWKIIDVCEYKRSGTTILSKFDKRDTKMLCDLIQQYLWEKDIFPMSLSFNINVSYEEEFEYIENEE